jgi:pheromone a factor receptor
MLGWLQTCRGGLAGRASQLTSIDPSSTVGGKICARSACSHSSATSAILNSDPSSSRPSYVSYYPLKGNGTLKLRQNFLTILNNASRQLNVATNMSKTGDTAFLSRPASATLLPVLATIACILCFPTLVSHIRSRNLAASVLTFWIVLENVFNLINPLLWPSKDLVNGWNGAGLCDVESKLRLAASVGYVGALVCIYRHLAVILNTEQIALVASPAQWRRRITIEMALCFGFPVYIMVASYIVQSGRYYVFPIAGCVPMLDSSWPSTVLVLIWPGIMWVVAAGYCSTIIHRLIKYRRQVSGILSSPHSRYNQSQFIRLFAMATALIVIFLPVALYIFVLNLSFPAKRRTYSWSRVHNWTPIYFTRSYSGETFDCWVEVVTGYVVFISFGFGRDALLTYRRVLRNLGLGKIFPRLRYSGGQGVRGALGDVSLATRFGSVSSWARLIFSHRSNETPSLV